jgi:hypothetical protein
MLAVIVAIRVGMRLEIWQAVVLAVTGWILLQTIRRTIGRPLMRLQRWLASRAAGVSFDVRKQDIMRVRRRPTATWYRQLESWRRRRVKPPGEPPATASAGTTPGAVTVAPLVAPLATPGTPSAIAPEGQPHAHRPG